MEEEMEIETKEIAKNKNKLEIKRNSAQRPQTGGVVEWSLPIGWSCGRRRRQLQPQMDRVARLRDCRCRAAHIILPGPRRVSALYERAQSSGDSGGLRCFSGCFRSMLGHYDITMDANCIFDTVQEHGGCDLVGR